MIYVSRELPVITGMPREELMGDLASLLSYADLRDLERVMRMHQESIQT